jgi:hypothetical protein
VAEIMKRRTREEENWEGEIEKVDRIGKDN